MFFRIISSIFHPGVIVVIVNQNPNLELTTKVLFPGWSLDPFKKLFLRAARLERANEPRGTGGEARSRICFSAIQRGTAGSLMLGFTVDFYPFVPLAFSYG